MPLLVLAALALSLAACAAPAPMSDDRPGDFAVTLGTSTGSLPPPYHHSTRIRIGPDGAGTISTQTRYGEGPSETMAFSLDDDAMDGLYADLVATGVFGIDWSRDANPPVGGGSTTLTLVADGRTVEIPGFVARGREEKRQAAERVEAAVPAETRLAMEAWRQNAQTDGPRFRPQPGD